MSSGDESEENEPQPPSKKRKQWLKGGKVPRETYRRWMAQDRDEGEVSDPDQANLVDAGHQAFNNDSQADLTVEVHQEVINDDDGGMDSESSSQSSIETNGSPEFSSDSGQENVNSSSESDCEYDTRPMNIPLFPGSKNTKGEAVSQLLDLCCKHTVSKALLNDLVVYTHNLLPRHNTFPPTPYFFEKEIGPFIPPDLCVPHFCCENCGAYLGTTEERQNNCVCTTETVEKQFYEFPLTTQIKYLFEERNLADAMDSYKTKAGNCSDICTAEEYLTVRSKFNGKYDVILLTNADGLSPHKNSCEEIWALTYTICEVPPSLRKVFTMVTQIWYGKKKPYMNGFMVPFAKSTADLCKKGVVWTHPKTKVVHTTRGTAPAYTLDAPARAMLQNITSHSGAYSCNICEIEGERIKHGKGTKTIFPYIEDEDLVLRDKDVMDTQQNSVLTDGIVCKGVRGDSILNSIPYCNRGNALIYDYMHLVLLGVTRQFFQMWIKGEKNGLPTKKGHKPPWYIGSKSKTIDRFLISIQRIYEFTRFPKYTAKFKANKASAWLVWLLFVSVPALHNNLREEYFQHWLLLVIAMNLLLQEVIPQDDIEMARLLLSVFAEEAQNLYGKEAMTYNVHGLQHMALMVKRWGGLWATSTFLFEGYNGVIVRNLHGTIHISQEFGNVFGRHIANVTLKNVLSTEDEECRSRPLVKGKVFYSDLSEQELELLHQLFPAAQRRVPLYGRVQMGKTIYTSISYTAERATNNKSVCFNRNKKNIIWCY
ncbi:hypothetical protein FOCC_FOCC017003 [Frankliniella occidentalis]|uniref:Uncharacterized protein LOC127751766 n=1 Tax=Frankliniella occidentalis TaxID=133901 RepID=A0A9C6XUV0_FRAOC|nr:uncharacterized protein LOC127751766 [Frankliniella occidentalis]KAE8737533.1 hypothetical protein FOCC_FOCC017003 [Frankliniella occidentalis]